MSRRSKAERKKEVSITSRIKWYGGCVSEVYAEGRRVRIHYDDGTSEVSEFPDDDIFIDDIENGEHKVSANSFKFPLHYEKSESRSSSPTPDEMDPRDRRMKPKFIKRNDYERDYDNMQDSEERKSESTTEAKKEKRLRERNTERIDVQDERGSRISPPSAKTSTVTDSSFSLSSNQNSANEYSESSCSIASNDIASTPLHKKKEIQHSSSQKPVDNTIFDQKSVLKSDKSIRAIPKIKISNSFSRIDKSHSPDESKRFHSQLSLSSTEDECYKPRKKTLVKSRSLTIKLGKREKGNSPKLIESERKSFSENFTVSKDALHSKMMEKDEIHSSLGNQIFRPRKVDVSEDKDKLGKYKNDFKYHTDSIEMRGLPCSSTSTEENVMQRSIAMQGPGENCYNEKEMASTVSPLNSGTEKSAASPPQSSPSQHEKNISEEAVSMHKIESDFNLQSLPKKKNRENIKSFCDSSESVEPMVKKKNKETEFETKEDTDGYSQSTFTRSISPVTLLSSTKNSLSSSYNKNECVVLSNTSDPVSGTRPAFKSNEKNFSTAVLNEVANESTTPSLEDVSDSNSVKAMSRSGRLAAHKANQRITSKHENSDEDSSVSRRKNVKKMASSELDESPSSEKSVLSGESHTKEEREPWVQCDRCEKWRLLPRYVQMSTLPERWYCELNIYDPKRNHCGAPEQTAKDIASQRKKAKLNARNQRRAGTELDGRRKRSVSPTPNRSPKRHTSDQNELENDILPKNNNSARNEDLIQNIDTSDLRRNYPVKKRNQSGSKGSSDNLNKLEERNKEDFYSGKSRSLLRGRGRGKDSERSGKNGKGNKQQSKEKPENQEWVQCENCEKWRKLPLRISAEDLPDKWYCHMNTWDPSTASCDVAEEKPDSKLRTKPAPQPTGKQKTSSELSYKNLIFGTGKRQLRPSSERARAAESLFAFATQPHRSPNENVGNNFPTLAYADSFAYVRKQGSNSTRANLKSERNVSFLDVLSTSRVWDELYGFNATNSDAMVGMEENDKTSSASAQSNLMKQNSQLMKDFVYSLVSEKTMNVQDIFLQTQSKNLEAEEKNRFKHLQTACNINDTCNVLDELVRDGLIETMKVKVSFHSESKMFWIY